MKLLGFIAQKVWLWQSVVLQVVLKVISFLLGCIARVKTVGEGFPFLYWSWKMKHPLGRSKGGLERKVGKQTSLSASLVLAFLP